MEKSKASDPEKHYIRFSTPSKEDVEYVKMFFKKGIASKEDLQANMSFIIPYHGPESEGGK